MIKEEGAPTVRSKSEGFSGYKFRSCIAAAVVVGVTATIGNFSVAAAEPEVAGEFSGNEFYHFCDQPPYTEEDVLYETFCFGYVLGVIEAKMYNACLPDNLAFEQALDIVRAWVRNNPVQRHLNAAVLIRSALESAYACE